MELEDSIVTPIECNDLKIFVDANKDTLFTVAPNDIRDNVVVDTNKYFAAQTACAGLDHVITQSIIGMMRAINPSIVSSESFKKNIQSCYSRLIIKMVNMVTENERTVFYFHLGDALDKSNFWLCLLFINILYKHKAVELLSDRIFFHEDLTFAKDEISYITKHDKNNNNVAVYLDDCAYSGTQLASTVSNAASSIANMNNSGKGNIIVALPYITLHAIKKIGILSDEIYFIYEEVMENIYTNKQLLDTLLKNNLYFVSFPREQYKENFVNLRDIGYEFAKDIKYKESMHNQLIISDLLSDVFGISMLRTTPSIFTFKIADAYSIPQYMYNYAKTYAPDKDYFLLKLSKEHIEEILVSIADKEQNIRSTKDVAELENNVEIVAKLKNEILNTFGDWLIKYYASDQDMKKVTPLIYGFELLDISGKKLTNENCGKNIGILNNCQESYVRYVTENTGNIEKVVDIARDNQCYNAIYRDYTYKIPKSLKDKWLNILKVQYNIDVLNEYKVIESKPLPEPLPEPLPKPLSKPLPVDEFAPGPSGRYIGFGGNKTLYNINKNIYMKLQHGVKY